MRVPTRDHGLSAIEVSADGGRFTALSDRGVLLTGRLLRSGGRLTEVQVDHREPLEVHSLPDAPAEAAIFDSEGLALLPDGRILVAFEGQHRLATYGGNGTLRRVTSFPDAVQSAHLNEGIEALAVLPDGAIIAVPETPVGESFPVWRLRPGAKDWTRMFALAAGQRFRPVGADVGPDGRIYLLERAFEGVGFAARIRSMAMDGAELRLEAAFPLGQHGNLEGLSVWCDQAGRLRATMVEDDNGLALQRSAVVELELSVDRCGATG